MIFSQPVQLDKAVITQRCKEVAYLLEGVTLILRDERSSEATEQVFHAPNGLCSLVDDLRTPDTLPVHDVIYGSIKKHIRKPYWGTPHYDVKFAIQFMESKTSIELGYCNTVQTMHGGYHMVGLRAGLIQALNQHCLPHTNMFRWNQLSGLVSAISIYHPNPQYESITKINLLNAEIHQ